MSLGKIGGFITGNQLKMIALLAMTCDHVGKHFFPQQIWLQVIGRLAFPIFAYMVAEGCSYTKNRKRYFAMMAGLAFLCQAVYFIAMGSLYQSVLVTFTLTILLIYLIDWAKGYVKGKMQEGEETATTTRTILGSAVVASAVLVAGFGLVWFISVELPVVLWRTDYNIDYGFAGILLVVGIYIVKGRLAKLLMAAAMLCILGFTFEGIQWYGLLVLPFLAAYNGQRGGWNLKYLFYIYYPAHLAVIYLVSVLL